MSPQKKWYVIYTRSRAEKKVLSELQYQGIDCFLPLQKKLRQWKDRKKWVEVPLISGYCFVYIDRKNYDSVLLVKNVVCYVGFRGKAAIIPENQINHLKKMLRQYDFEVNVTEDNFAEGKRVEIIKGPLIGLQGELVEIRGKHKFILRINQMETSFSVEVPATYISALP